MARAVSLVSLGLVSRHTSGESVDLATLTLVEVYWMMRAMSMASLGLA